MTLACFVHQGRTAFLKYAVRQALSVGYEVVVLGDQQVARALPEVEVVPLASVMKRAERFARRYHHISLNDPGYELFCYQRWFALLEFQERQGQPLLVLDSDLLIYPGADQALSKRMGNKGLCNTPWTNLIRRPEALQPFCDFLDQVFADRAEVERLAHLWGEGLGRGPHLADMELMFEYGQRHPDQVHDLEQDSYQAGFDNMVRDTQAHQALHGHKRIAYWRDGAPWIARPEGEPQRFFTLHFQGISKPLMEFLHTIRADLLAGLEELEPWLERRRGRGHADWADVSALYQELKAAKRNGLS